MEQFYNALMPYICKKQDKCGRYSDATPAYCVITVIRRRQRVPLSLHLTNAPRNLNAPYTHAEA